MTKPPTPSPAPFVAKSDKWWDQEDAIMIAPWYIRYPLGVATGCAAWYVGFEWKGLNLFGHILFGGMLAFITLGFIRELFFGTILAVIVGLILWACGAVVAALPVSVAIIIGAMIIASQIGRKK